MHRMRQRVRLEKRRDLSCTPVVKRAKRAKRFGETRGLVDRVRFCSVLYRFTACRGTNFPADLERGALSGPVLAG
jgi:hypothetical protein